MRRIVNGLAVTLAAAMLAGCGQAREQAAQPPAGDPVVHPSWTSCAAEAPKRSYVGADRPPPQRLGNNFTATAVVVCGEESVRRPDGRDDLVATESRAGDVAALVAALRLPDVPPTKDACSAEMLAVPWFALLDAQARWVRPGLPADACGKIRIEVRDALAALKLTRVEGQSRACSPPCGRGR